MDILNFQDLKIKRNTILSTPNPWLKFKIYAQIYGDGQICPAPSVRFYLPDCSR